jgi:hypothetical protein
MTNTANTTKARRAHAAAAVLAAYIQEVRSR